jgi:hypothetical protein
VKRRRDVFDLVDNLPGATDERQHVDNAELKVGRLLAHSVLSGFLLSDPADLRGHDTVDNSQEAADAVPERGEAFVSGMLG